MQRVLEKMAKQLNEYDEASLMQFWQQYASLVHNFEPTRRWEEAAVILCLIQAVRWKNQLFNYLLAASANPTDKTLLPPLPDAFTPRRPQGKDTAGAEERAMAKATVLRFPEKSRNSAAPATGPDAEGRKDE
ncbi:MAG: hypothetical protein FWF99_02245 [Desulfovibrionaceae bacterium]|nr:hypothetical protein [Desulfovibrionaceae bacterium]